MNQINKLVVRESNNFAEDFIEFTPVIVDNIRSTYSICSEMIFTAYENTAAPNKQVQSFSISHEEATEVMNRLWALGIKPRGLNQHPETIQALKDHISDLNKVIDALLKEKIGAQLQIDSLTKQIYGEEKT